MPTATATKPAIASKPAELGYLARQTLARREARRSAVRTEFRRFEALEAALAAKARIVLARELARFKTFEAKYPPAKMHTMADTGGKRWQHRDLTVLQRHIRDRNRTINSPAYKSVQAAYRSASRTPALDRLRARRLAEDDAYWGD